MSEQPWGPQGPPPSGYAAVPVTNGKATAAMIIRAPKDWADDAHPAPARQWMYVLSGSAEVSAGGETRVARAGDVLFLEDTTGSGHGARYLEDTVVAVVRV